MKYFKDSQVLRNENNELEISWNMEDVSEVGIFSLIDGSEEFIAKSRLSKFKAKDYYKNKRCLFVLKSINYHYEIVGEKLLPLEGTHNFIDLGGYKSEDGRRVKWNLLYKSDKISNLTEKDVLYIKNLKIKTIFD